MVQQPDHPSDTNHPPSVKLFIAIAWRGFFMGGADVVPGVSGGTVALILGIYERLVTAISRVDGTLFRLLLRGRIQEAAAHLDLFFLFSLAMGVGAGLLTAVFTINKLLQDEVARAFTLAAFFGMILASGILVARLVTAKTLLERFVYIIVGCASAAFAYWISSLANDHAGDPSQLYIFLCGSIAICAMILPGISGAMILLLLGVYEHLTDIPEQLVHGVNVSDGLLTIVVFGLGCAISLVCFSKFLKWLLKHYHSLTMAMLCGLLFGGLRKLWPFLHDTTPEIVKFKHKHFEVRLPETLTEFITVASVALLAAIFIIAAEYFVNRSSPRGKQAIA